MHDPHQCHLLPRALPDENLNRNQTMTTTTATTTSLPLSRCTHAPCMVAGHLAMVASPAQYTRSFMSRAKAS